MQEIQLRARAFVMEGLECTLCYNCASQTFSLEKEGLL